MLKGSVKGKQVRPVLSRRAVKRIVGCNLRAAAVLIPTMPNALQTDPLVLASRARDGDQQALAELTGIIHAELSRRWRRATRAETLLRD